MLQLLKCRQQIEGYWNNYWKFQTLHHPQWILLKHVWKAVSFVFPRPSMMKTSTFPSLMQRAGSLCNVDCGGKKLEWFSSRTLGTCYSLSSAHITTLNTAARSRSGAMTRARQNGDHSDHRSQKVIIFDRKFYLSFRRFCLPFDGKIVSVTETNILLLTIWQLLVWFLWW